MKFSKISMLLPALVLCCCAFIFSACGDSRLSREAPSISKANIVVTDKTIRIDGFNDALYSKDRGENWQEQNIFTDLVYNNTYFICVKLKANDEYKESAMSNVIEIKISKTPATKPMIRSNNIVIDGNRATVVGFTNALYSKDGGLNWQESNVFVNLEDAKTYFICVKIKETDTAGASEPSDVYELKMPKIKQDAPLLTQENVVYSEANNLIRVEGFGTNVLYSKDGGLTSQESNIFSNLVHGSTYKICICYKETEIYDVSSWSQIVTISLDKVIQNTPVLALANIKQDGFNLIVTGLENRVASYSIDGGLTWAEDYTNTFENLTIGQTYQICVKLEETDTHYGTGVSNVVTYTMQKIEQQAPVLTLDNIVQDDYTLTIVGFENKVAQYSIDNGASWHDSNIFTNLILTQTYDIKIRLLETDTHLSSPESVAYSYTMSKLERQAPTFDISEISQENFSIIVNQREGIEYSIDNGVNWQTNNVFDNLTIGLPYNVTIRYAENNTYNSSPSANAIEFTLQKLTPMQPVLSAENIIQDMYSLVITGFSEGTAEYSIDDGLTWRGNNRFDNLIIGNSYLIKVRLIENNNYIASVPSESYMFTLQKLIQLAPELHIINEEIDGQKFIVIQEVEGAEYKFDDGEWGSENRISADCSSSHTVYIRMAETTDYRPSDYVSLVYQLAHTNIWEFESYPTATGTNKVNEKCSVCNSIISSQNLGGLSENSNGVFISRNNGIYELNETNQIDLDTISGNIYRIAPVLTETQISDGIVSTKLNFVCEQGNITFEVFYGTIIQLDTSIYTGISQMNITIGFNTLDDLVIGFNVNNVENNYFDTLNSFVGEYKNAELSLQIKYDEGNQVFSYLLPNAKVLVGENLQDDWKTFDIQNIKINVSTTNDVTTILSFGEFIFKVQGKNLVALNDGVYTDASGEINTIYSQNTVFEKQLDE